MINKVRTAAITGLEGTCVEIEGLISNGLPYFKVVGLIDATVKESRERVRGAISSSGFKFPDRKIIVSLSPGDVKKRGTHFDLPLAICILRISGQISGNLDNLDRTAFIGELSLDGSVKSASGVLAMVKVLVEAGIKRIVVPYSNRIEASLIKDAYIVPVKTLSEAIMFLEGNSNTGKYTSHISSFNTYDHENLDFSQVKGQEVAKRGICIAASGGHGIMMMGSPSCGKTMLAKRIPYILPSMAYDEILEATMVHSVAGLLKEDKPIISERPFRRPHHSITRAGMIGGGLNPVPGEISLASKGVLFLDELPELKRDVIEALRLPLEEKYVPIFRTGRNISFPADFLLVAACNPCPCGNYTDPYRECSCSPKEISNYMRKLSGPIMERIDLHIYMEHLDYNEFTGSAGMSSTEMKEIVINAREIQKKRFRNYNITLNSQMEGSLIESFCNTDSDSNDILRIAFEKHILTPRTYQKTLKISRTIADMECSSEIKSNHVMESIQYRRKLNEYD